MKAVAIAAVVFTPLAFGCVSTPDGVQELTIEQAATMAATGTATFCDANGQSTRDKYGTVPGAVLLSNYRNYDMSELPPDKASTVVFYCSSTLCSAAPKAADRAVKAGYTNVAYMPQGIRGWVDADKPVSKVKEKG